MMTTSSFMSTLTVFAFVVGSLLRIALKVSIFSSLIHSHKLKVRSGLLEAAALFKLVLMFLCQHRRNRATNDTCAASCAPRICRRQNFLRPSGMIGELHRMTTAVSRVVQV